MVEERTTETGSRRKTELLSEAALNESGPKRRINEDNETRRHRHASFLFLPGHKPTGSSGGQWEEKAKRNT